MSDNLSPMVTQQLREIIEARTVAEFQQRGLGFPTDSEVNAELDAQMPNLEAAYRLGVFNQEVEREKQSA